MANDYTSTVAAVSTPRGKGGVALIRISGEEAVVVADRCFSPKCGKPTAALEARRLYRGNILAGGEVIDDGMLTIFHAPASYTGEDMAEITCHGGMLVTQRVLEAVLLAGAVAAPPGEFTRRAFVNGKLSLTRAEAIGAVLDAKSDAQLRIAGKQREGALADKIEAVMRTLTALIADVYAKIDYPEEDLSELTDSEFIRRAEQTEESLEALLRTYRAGQAIFEGISAVICGAPNRGKSSLYNALAGDDAAIVTEVAGTTRDLLEREIPVGRVLLRLCDTAGIHKTDDPVEQIGISRARARLESAGLILCVFDDSKPLDEDDRELLDRMQKCTTPKIALLNKSDLGKTNFPKEAIAGFSHTLRISAKTGMGLDALRQAVEELFLSGSIDADDGAIVTGARQFAALSGAAERIRDAIKTCKGGYGTDLAASDLERAAALLGEIDGRGVSEAVVTEIFSRFCVGK